MHPERSRTSTDSGGRVGPTQIIARRARTPLAFRSQRRRRWWRRQGSASDRAPRRRRAAVAPRWSILVCMYICMPVECRRRRRWRGERLAVWGERGVSDVSSVSSVSCVSNVVRPRAAQKRAAAAPFSSVNGVSCVRSVCRVMRAAQAHSHLGRGT